MSLEAQGRRAAGLPTLPPEVLQHVVEYLSIPASEGELGAITRLTAASAGWESEMLRLLHYCGATVEYLSLWQTESRALLRDAAQVRREGSSQPIWAIGEQPLMGDEPEEPMYPPVDPNDIPRWLRSELEHAPSDQVAKQHLAHFPFAPRTNTAEWWRARPRPRACTPRFLSMVMSYPFYENERPELFSNMIIWSRVEELDIYVSSDVPKSLLLLAQLGHTPIRRLRVSTSHASLAIETNGSSAAQYTNACAALHTLVSSKDLAQALVHEFAGRFIHEPIVLETACLRCLEGEPPAPPTESSTQLATEYAARRKRLAMRLSLTQGNQAIWGKLKHRQWDFRERAQFHREGAWSLLLR
ncbi:hypothetical protein CBS9595_002530 [Malassezia furfur]|nr:hypothetical protein CBS9595_002530 [Malassezia furfur]